MAGFNLKDRFKQTQQHILEKDKPKEEKKVGGRPRMNEEDKKVNVTVKISPYLLADIKEYCKSTGLNVSRFIEMACHTQMKQQQLLEPHPQAVPDTIIVQNMKVMKSSEENPTIEEE